MIRYDCGSNECREPAEFTCPLCQLRVCKKHQKHAIQYDDTKPVKAHSVVR